MFGHDENPVFFDEKNKDWTFRTPAKPPLPYVLKHLIFTLVLSSPLPHPASPGKIPSIRLPPSQLSFSLVNVDSPSQSVRNNNFHAITR